MRSRNKPSQEAIRLYLAELGRAKQRKISGTRDAGKPKRSTDDPGLIEGGRK